MAVALSRTKTPISFWIIIRVAPRLTTIMAGISFFRDMRMPNGNTNRAYITRINLDVAHPDHRITLLTPGRRELV